MGHPAAAVAGNAIRGLLKSASFQRIGVILEGGQTQLGLPEYDAGIITGQKALVDFFEESCKQKSIAEVKKVPQNLHS